MPLLLSQVEAPGDQPVLRLPLCSIDLTNRKILIRGISAIRAPLSNCGAMAFGQESASVSKRDAPLGCEHRRNGV